MQTQATNIDFQFKLHHSIDEIDETQWRALAVGAGPFLQYQWLKSLQNSGCTDGQTGWQTAHWSAWVNDKLVMVVPGYLKTHSYGEYVFDHSWANAYHQHHLEYYPKWIAAIPFTPVTGPRLLKAEHLTANDTAALINHINHWASTQGYSSCHWLFCPPASQQDFQALGLASRYSVQFQWANRGYSSFDDFLSRLTSRKRRSIRKTRQRFVNAPEITIERLHGDALRREDMAFFVHCYQDTYLKRSGHTGYLTPAFFTQIYDNCREQLMLVKASFQDAPVAAALFLYDENGLYGRYWGCLQDIDELHFECCYFQGIDFAIEQGLPLFNPGTQGEHKILRGFEPVFCVSHHKMHDPRFHQAVADFLQQEKPAIEDYFNQARDVLPFNADYIKEFVTPTSQDEAIKAPENPNTEK
ncbi:GNAT family N-acetyltransferase [Alteromonas lipolytica]|uniref:GNAT family N-acetyltransferase n=1 Tax=Alteromonas lipolytica TaxID=1856405 RepID=A0A1E8FIP2_9ALTE|nr:GNAT family N-acetyltransferase [Alteromonas lipolytica]OFI35333.1 hypothetical protein BFC17_13710 [Alteromonas lipolytica]